MPDPASPRPPPPPDRDPARPFEGWVPARLRLMVVDPDLRRRLQLLDHLGERFDVEAPPEGVDLQRFIRTASPEAVLLFVHPLRPTAAYSLCRWLKTDARPVRFVAIVNIGGPPRHPGAVQEHELADGYYEGPLDLEILRTFTAELVAGRRPIHVAAEPQGMLNRVLRRVLARTR